MRLVSAIYRDGYPFDQLSVITDCIHTSDPKDLQSGDMLVVWGGADISPSLYGKPVGKHTYADDVPSHRDRVEWNLMQRAKELSIPIVGICRGAQMLCALAGGFLIQHVEKHGGHHIVTTIDGEEINTNSIHHQMMYPFDVPHEMVLSIKKPLSPIHLDVDTNIDVPEEPEYVYFPEIRGFAAQHHPEMMQLSSRANQFLLNHIETKLKSIGYV